MSIGFVSIIMNQQDIRLRSCILKNATPENLLRLIEHNLTMLDKMLDWNFQNNIHLFRISSEIIPFGSHPINVVAWWELFQTQLRALGDKAKKLGIRLSFHPGQYTTLSSPNAGVVARAILDLKYHARFLDTMGVDFSNKIILHIGSKYGNKEQAVRRFIKNFKNLPVNVRRRIVLENDELHFTADDILKIARKTKCPAVFDLLHHQINNSGNLSVAGAVLRCRKSWRRADGVQKIHYSQQAPGKRIGSHSETISLPQFLAFYKILPQPIDIMLEVKDKSLSALKCISAVKNL